MERMMMESGQSNAELDDGVMRPNLRHAPSQEGFVRGSYNGHVTSVSPVTEAQLHPAVAAAVATGLGLAAAVGINYVMNAADKSAGARSRRKSSTTRANSRSESTDTSRVTH
jgi:hypothetical protein